MTLDMGKRLINEQFSRKKHINQGHGEEVRGMLCGRAGHGPQWVYLGGSPAGGKTSTGLEPAVAHWVGNSLSSILDSGIS